MGFILIFALSMQRRLIFDSQILSVTIKRLCHQLIENHGNFDETVVLGLQPRGIFLAQRIKDNLQDILSKEINLGYLDATFHRDDFRRKEGPIKANATHIPFVIEDKKVILIDDVLFTGRTVRAAMDAMISFGRPRKVEFLVLVNRKYNRDLPIEPNYVGRHVNTLKSQRVLVEWKEQDKPDDNIWLIEKPV
jgi:pyrimidine operon attenuation protein / uracil phosphoribosyltransferase